MTRDLKINWTELLRLATEMRQRSYAPYSNFQVGAALLTADGKIFSGCNVENASYGLALCAERTAIVSAVAHGQQEFLAIAVAATPLATPCGACRQFIAEFGLHIQVAAVDPNSPDAWRQWVISDLLPDSFSL